MINSRKPSSLPLILHSGLDDHCRLSADTASAGIRRRIPDISLDPAMRGSMNEGKSCIPPVGMPAYFGLLDVGKPT